MIKKIKGWETDNHTVTNGCRENYYRSSDLPVFTIPMIIDRSLLKEKKNEDSNNTYSVNADILYKIYLTLW